MPNQASEVSTPKPAVQPSLSLPKAAAVRIFQSAPLPIGLNAKDPGGGLPVVADLAAADEPEGRARERVGNDGIEDAWTDCSECSGRREVGGVGLQEGWSSCRAPD
jgi:hypothetical protein